MNEVKSKSTIKTPGFIRNKDDNFRFDFQLFYELGGKAEKIIKSIKTTKETTNNGSNAELSIGGLCFQVQRDVYRDCFYLTETEDIRLPDLQLELSQEDVENVNKQIIDLIKQLKGYKFQAALIEISLFDPRDPEGSAFHTFIYAPSKELLKSYMKEMKINASETKKRGPIIPDSNLYDFPLLQLDYPDSDSDSVAAPMLDSNSQEVYLFIVSQKIYRDVNEKKKVENYVSTAEDVKDFVTNFFTGLQDNVFKKRDKNSSYQSNFLNINTAMLIPLLRPAGLLKDGLYKEDRLRGGGLFLYGCFNDELTKKDQSLQDMALWLKNKANKEIMHQSHTAVDVEAEKFKSRAAILHYIPYAFFESIKKLIKYEKSHPDFEIPTSLYIVAVETALYARGHDKEELKKFIFRLPVADTLKEKGLGKEVFEELSNERGISRRLAEYSLATHSSPIFSKQLKKPEVVVEGYLPFEKLRLNDDIKIRVFIALLIVILKESIEHTERYINNYSPDDEDYRKVRVLIEDNSITIKNPASADADWSSAEENGTQREAIDLFKQYLGREWECQTDHQNEKGWWVYSLRIGW